MSLQIRVSTPEFSNGIAFSDPIILENADQISLTKTVSSSDEGISFNFPLNDPKNEDITYLMWWECWDTQTNTRLNFGPINSISRTSGDAKTITGPGRSAIFADYYKSIQTFYSPIDVFLDDLRYENIAIQPRTATLIDTINTDDSKDPYYGLSKRTKDFAIDEQTGWIAIGRDSPAKGTIKTNEFWAGTGKADWLTIDLGIEYTIAKSKLLLPWWGGSTINNNRAYEFTWEYSEDNEIFTPLYTTPSQGVAGNPKFGGIALYSGEEGFEWGHQVVANEAIPARYWKLNITNTHAWYGSGFTGEYYTGQTDEWNWECAGSNIFQGTTKQSPNPSTGSIIPTDKINPNSDCYASAVEIGIFKKIIDRDFIGDLAYHQIEHDNKQIRYSRVPLEEEMIPCGGGTNGLKFEPGTFFRNTTISATNTHIKDEYNTILYTDLNSGFIKLPAWCRLIQFYNDANARVMEVDSWKGQIDAYSYGGSYAYCEEQNDSAIIDFRGVSFKWYATVPSGNHGVTEGDPALYVSTTPSGRLVPPGQVSIELRHKLGSISTHTSAPTMIPGSTSYRVKVLSPTNYYTTGTNGRIPHDPPHIHLPTGTTVTCSIVHVPFNTTKQHNRPGLSSHPNGGTFYKILSGTYKGHLISNLTNSLHYGKISVTKLHTDTTWTSTAPYDVVSTEWTPWVLIDTITLPSSIAGEKVWEIPLGSDLLEYDTSYQLRITNLNAGFVSIDAFAGYWSGTMEDLNEDDDRIGTRNPSEIIQEYNKKYTAGSIYKFRAGVGSYTKQGFSFEGDRIIVYSRKGNHFGKMTIGLRNGDTGEVIAIPTGHVDRAGVDIPIYETDGHITFDLQRSTEIPQYIIFDTADYFADGLPWGRYSIGIYKPTDSDPIYVDGISAHLTTGLSCKFINTSYIDILKSTAQALQLEWDFTENGLKIVPRIGTDTNIIFAEGRGTTIRIDDVEDISKIATMLITTGADIEGLPLFTVVENKQSRETIGRTIQRTYDELRNVADYFTLIGASRLELTKRREPEKRITIVTTDNQGIIPGDTCIVKTPELEERVRVNTISRTQSSSSGTEYTMECTIWLTII